MARYINVDEYKKHLDMICGSGYSQQVTAVYIEWFMSIADRIAVDAPVVHAHWVSVDYHECSNATHECSNCHAKRKFTSYKDVENNWQYCGHCGAKMDEEEGQR